MLDITETVGKSSIQHGHHSKRIYLMKLHEDDLPEILDTLAGLALEKGYTKIFAKVPREAARDFLARGFREEAAVPAFYRGVSEAVFLGRYFSETRAKPQDEAKLSEVLEIARSRAVSGLSSKEPPPEYLIEKCTPADVKDMSALYRIVFATYPFPIHDPAYLRETMASHIDYYCVRHNGRICALASSEMDLAGGNVEMTDFATHPEVLGHGFAVSLLRVMEEAMQARKMHTAYTIARAVSPGMNVTFAKSGYAFAGTLVNNTNISGQIESMNIWYKHLQPSG